MVPVHSHTRCCSAAVLCYLCVHVDCILLYDSMGAMCGKPEAEDTPTQQQQQKSNAPTPAATASDNQRQQTSAAQDNTNQQQPQGVLPPHSAAIDENEIGVAVQGHDPEFKESDAAQQAN